MLALCIPLNNSISLLFIAVVNVIKPTESVSNNLVNSIEKLNLHYRKVVNLQFNKTLGVIQG